MTDLGEYLTALGPHTENVYMGEALSVIQETEYSEKEHFDILAARGLISMNELDDCLEEADDMADGLEGRNGFNPEEEYENDCLDVLADAMREASSRDGISQSTLNDLQYIRSEVEPGDFDDIAAYCHHQEDENGSEEINALKSIVGVYTFKHAHEVGEFADKLDLQLANSVMKSDIEGAYLGFDQDAVEEVISNIADLKL